MPSKRTQKLLKGATMIGPRGYDPMWDDRENNRYYDREGEKISMREWVMLREHVDDYYRIDYTELEHYFVSTVWLGLDHGFNYSGVPIIFESMVFENELTTSESLTLEGGAMDGLTLPERDFHESVDQVRYATVDQAREGHAKLVEEWRGARKEISHE